MVIYPMCKKDSIEITLSSFVNCQSLRALVESFGGYYPSSTEVQNLHYLLEFSSCWDYRAKNATRTENNENARWLIEQNTLTELQKKYLEATKKDLGLVGNSSPQNQSYDYIWVLGGAKLSCLLRTKLASEICKNLVAQPKKISLLGSSRPINESERATTNTYAPNAKTEFDLFLAAHDAIFPASCFSISEDTNFNQNSNWRVLEYDDGISILSAPSSMPNVRRANSLDTYLFFMKTYNVPPGSRILLVTSEIYVPYQHLEAYRSVALKYDVGIETVGFPSMWGGELQGMVSDENFLQEIRSSIQSMNRLVNEIGVLKGEEK